jgi:formylglycine-generating enzyme
MKYLPLLVLLPFLLPAQSRKGRDYAVFFYVTDFRPGIQDIPFAKREVEELAEELGANYGFECTLVRECKKEDIISALERLSQTLTPADQVLLCFSMHGHYDVNSDRGFLIPADGEPKFKSWKTWLSYDDLRTHLGEFKAGHILVALDACYSGSFGTRGTKKMPAENDALYAPDCITRINNVLELKGRQFFASGKSNEETPQRSIFLAELLSTLRKGYDIEGLIFFEDLAYQLHKLKNPEPEDGVFSGHKPGGDFVFVRKNSCAKKIDRDGDNIPDHLDNCPDVFGTLPNGCSSFGRDDSTMLDIKAWRSAKNSNQIKDYESYLKKFPNGEFVRLAQDTIKRLNFLIESERDWMTAVSHNTIDGYLSYSKKWPNKHKDECKQKIVARDLIVFDQEMIFVKGGEYTMGTAQKGSKVDSIELEHKVIVSDFRIGKYEVTYEQWKSVMGTLPSTVSHFFDPNYKYSDYRPDTCSFCPVTSISYWEAKKFMDRLNKKYPNKKFRLPTEAEWEYAAKGGPNQNIIEEEAISKYNDYKIARVGTKEGGNPLGLFDMNGNVFEWCADWYDPNFYACSPTINPVGPQSGTKKVLRGACTYQNGKCRITYRGHFDPNSASSTTGFRLVSAE